MERPTRIVLLITLGFISVSLSQELPEELECTNPKAIKLPASNKCLVLVNEPMNFTASLKACEAAGGSLYKMPSARLYTRPRLMDCLANYNGSDSSDLWLNGISLWSPQFIWNNRTIVNKVSYCPTELPPSEETEMNSETLSVDYCVSICHNKGSRFIAVYLSNGISKCNCLHILEDRYKVPCQQSIYNYQDSSKVFIVHSRESSLISIGSANTFSSTEIMCATVDAQTHETREMKSDTCFTQRPFLCELGTAQECKDVQAKLQCVNNECLFECANKCLKRVSTPLNWYAAQSYCASLGGSLWKMGDLNDMNQVTQFLRAPARYWIGASNYVWSFDATSRDINTLKSVGRTLRCGHMVRELAKGDAGSRTWRWSDADCNQQKSFLCELDEAKSQSSSNEGSSSSDVVCPWPIIYTSNTGGEFGTGVTQFQTVFRDSSFPLAALIAGIIAGLTLLTCLGLGFAFCGKRHWSKVREHLTFIPYFSDNSHMMMGNSHDFDNMSHVGHSRSHMSSVSEQGSQIGLVKGGYSSSYGMSASHTETGGMFSSKSLDRGHLDTMGSKMADSHHYLASANNSMDERGFAATYSTMPSRQNEYMTLQAQMDIQDDAQLDAMRRSLRGKPEMTLVTDNADLNLTINHANSMSGSHVIGSNGISSSAGSISGVVTSSDRVLEEVTVPVTSEGGVILTFPDRIHEAHIYTNNGPSNGQVQTIIM